MFEISNIGLSFWTGSHIECLYALMTFGIIREVIPITSTGQVNLECHKMWVKRLQSECPEQNEAIRDFGTKKIIVPGPMDVILGRGTHAKNSMGHLRFQHLLEKYREQYDALSQSHRRSISRLMLLELNESGVRFIKQDDKGQWVEISEKERITKIAAGFRNLRTNVESSNASRLGKTQKKRTRVFDMDAREINPEQILGVD